MEKPRDIFTADQEATAVVAGEEQTLVAPPVVQLDADAPETPVTSAAPAALAYATPRRLPRRPTLLALVLCSVLIGGVLGGAGLYLYQRQSGGAHTPTAAAPGATAAQPEAPNTTPGETSQPAPAPADEAAAPTPDAQPAKAATDTPPAPESDAPDAPADEHRANSGGAGAAPAREPESVPTAGTPKRGKKGERDEEINSPTRRANRADSRAPVARADAGEREARRVDTIFYRSRRAAARDRARRQTAGDVDRLRRIFEGSPE